MVSNVKSFFWLQNSLHKSQQVTVKKIWIKLKKNGFVTYLYLLSAVRKNQMVDATLVFVR